MEEKERERKTKQEMRKIRLLSLLLKTNDGIKESSQKATRQDFDNIGENKGMSVKLKSITHIFVDI